MQRFSGTSECASYELAAGPLRFVVPAVVPAQADAGWRALTQQAARHSETHRVVRPADARLSPDKREVGTFQLLPRPHPHHRKPLTGFAVLVFPVSQLGISPVTRGEFAWRSYLSIARSPVPVPNGPPAIAERAPVFWSMVYAAIGVSREVAYKKCPDASTTT